MSLLKQCKTKKEVKELISYVRQTKYMAFDFETTGLEYHNELEYPTIHSLLTL